MSDVSRREAFLGLAAGAAGATVAAGFTGAAGATAPVRGGPMPPAGVLAAAAEAARKAGMAVERRQGMRAGEALVLHCRSWDGSIYLYVDEQVRGFAPVTATGFAIAAACQAAGRPVAAKLWGHDPRWGGGVGRFEGALLAVEAGDLPEDPSMA